MSSGAAGYLASGKGNLVLRLLVYLALIVLLGNLNAVTDKILHPEISYFDHEHLIEGGVTVLVVVALFGTLEVYLARRRRTEKLLEANEAQYRTILATAMDGFWITDHEGRFMDVNEAACRHLGYRREELLGGMRIQDIEALESPEETAAHIRNIREQGLDRFETRHRRRDGTVVDTEICVHYTDSGGGGYFTFIRDITARKMAEQALQRLQADLERKVRERTAALQASNELLGETQRQQRALLDAIPDAVYFKDREGRHRFVNRSFESSMGLSKDAVIGKGAEDLFPREMAETCRLSDREVHEKRSATRTEDAMAGPDGAIRLFETIKAPIFDERGDVAGLVGLTRDITQRKRNEAQLSAYREQLETMVEERTAALQDSEERFRSLVEGSLVGFFIVQGGKIVFANPEQKRIFGGCWKDCAASDFKCIHPGDRDRFIALCDESLVGRTGRAEAVIRQCPDGFPERSGSVRWLHCRATPMRYGGEKAVVVNMLDVTQPREMERIALAQEKMAALGHVATGVAHEIRNPLSGLNITLGVLGKTLEESEGLEPETRKETQTILKMAVAASTKIEAIVRRVMDLANPAPPKMVPISVNACTQDTLHLAGVTLRKAGVRLTTVLQTGLPSVWGDACLLEQVLLNLLTNAAQAMEGQEQEKRIEVASDVRDGHVVVSVADSGPGVPEEIREKVFDPFFTMKKGGTGIGLAFSRRVVSDHGGVLSVGTSRFGGALFTIGLPAGDRRAGDRQASTAI